MSESIDKSAKIGKGTEIGFNVVILRDVVIGEGCMIGNNVIIYEGTEIGNHVRIDDNTILGKKPLCSPRSIFKLPKDLKPAKIGDFCQIGANVIIYAQAEIGERNLIADMAAIRENVKIGDLNIIGRAVYAENFCEIGNRNKLESNCYITAYSKIEDYCFIAPGVNTSNDNFMARDKERFNHFKGVTLKTGARLGVNCTILPGKTIGKDVCVAGGALVTKDLEGEKIFAGVPAKEFRDVPDAQLLKNNLDK
ncbi:MAG: UDP-3-O-(3-hydroxymyristoyl)glucosamine N-acyltransferase [Candidatus Cloacimonadota bacterium]|nr:MAG: UDP-3-O-(3-hydroxymyristoyl)glucosamine N-acyltransferase [Candidatus Cloacimonadota bacterium]